MYAKEERTPGHKPEAEVAIRAVGVGDARATSRGWRCDWLGGRAVAKIDRELYVREGVRLPIHEVIAVSVRASLASDPFSTNASTTATAPRAVCLTELKVALSPVWKTTQPSVRVGSREQLACRIASIADARTLERPNGQSDSSAKEAISRACHACSD